MKNPDSKPFRILVVDDEIKILELYRTALSLPVKGQISKYGFEVVQCEQGDQALKHVKESIKADAPFSVAFLDLNLPPGPDGIWTGEEIRKIDPYINFVIVTGMPDIDLNEIASRIPPEDKILYIQKPFHFLELRQFATALSMRWRLERLLQSTNAELKEKVDELEKNRAELLESRSELENVNEQLMETNNALSVLARNLDRTKKESEKHLLKKTRSLIHPIIGRLQQSNHMEKHRVDIDLLAKHIEDLTSDITGDIKISASLSATELRIAAMIRNGMSSMEIAQQLHISSDTVKTHRKNIRKKLGLRNSKINLQSYLATEL